MAMLDLLRQFALEVLRALVVDELSGHVRRNLRRFSNRGASTTGAIFSVHRRNRDRLLNRLLTELAEEL